MSPDRRQRKDPTLTGRSRDATRTGRNRGDTTQSGRSHAREGDSGTLQIEAELPPAEERRRRKVPPPLPRFRRRTLEVDLTQIEDEEQLSGVSQVRPLPASIGRSERAFYAPCQDELALRLRLLLDAVGEGGTVRQIAERSGLEPEAVHLGLDILSAAGLIERCR
jgi:hypothetical protein